MDIKLLREKEELLEVFISTDLSKDELKKLWIFSIVVNVNMYYEKFKK